MPNHRAMSCKLLALATASLALLLPACGEKSAAEKAEEERVKIREEKRKQAAQLYRTLAKEYSDDAHADEAKQKAAALEGAKR